MQTPVFAFLSTSDMVLVAIVALVLFGAKKVPELMKGLGTGIREFKKASRDVQEELERAVQEEPPRPKRQEVREDHGSDSHQDQANTAEAVKPRLPEATVSQHDSPAAAPATEAAKSHPAEPVGH